MNITWMYSSCWSWYSHMPSGSPCQWLNSKCIILHSNAISSNSPICIAVALWSSKLQLKQPNLVYINPVLFAVQECCFAALVGSWYLVFELNAMQLTHIYYCHARMRVKYPEKGGEQTSIAQRPLSEVAGGEVSWQQECLVDVIVDDQPEGSIYRQTRSSLWSSTCNNYATTKTMFCFTFLTVWHNL